MTHDTEFSKILDDAIKKAVKQRGHINILIAGRTGVGKSTLINSIFQSNFATTGQGRPVTQNTRAISKDGIPLTIYDTRGLELKEFDKTQKELLNLVTDLKKNDNHEKHIHVAWICIQEDGRRVEEAEIELQSKLSEHVPVIGVITKSRADKGFRAEVQRLMPNAKNVVRVRSIREELDDSHVLEPMGLEELVEVTSEVIPEGVRKALAAVQKVKLDLKVDQSHKIVAAAAVTAAATGASPIPFSDVAILAPIQVGMLAGISATFGLEVSKASISTLISSAVGVTGASLTGRTVVANLLKFIPGAGYAVGATISATTAAALTTLLGEMYIYTLREIFKDDPSANPTMEHISKKYVEKLKMKTEK